MEISAPKPEITPAAPADFEGMKRLLDKANEYAVKRSGYAGWTAMDHVHGQIRTQLGNGELFVLRNNEGAITASVALTDNPGEWGQTAKDDPALYFHKLLKDPDISSPGDGTRLVHFVATEAQRRNKSFVRCDTVSDLTGLIKYYERLGFVDRGRFAYASTGRAGILLEAPTEVLLAKTIPKP